MENLKISVKHLEILFEKQFVFNIPKEDVILLYFVFLYENGMINKMAYLARCKQYVNGNLNRKINTFKYLGKWYNDDYTYNIYEDHFLSHFKKYNSLNYKRAEIDFKTLCENCQPIIDRTRKHFEGYSNSFDFCVDRFINPIIEYLGSIYYSHLTEKYLLDLGLGFYMPNYDDYEYHGYCCEDCDGDEGLYKQSQYAHKVADIQKELKNSLRKLGKNLGFFANGC